MTDVDIAKIKAFAGVARLMGFKDRHAAGTQVHARVEIDCSGHKIFTNPNSKGGVCVHMETIKSKRMCSLQIVQIKTNECIHLQRRPRDETEASQYP